MKVTSKTMKMSVRLHKAVRMPSQNKGMKLSLIVLAGITLVYIALGFASGDATQIDVGFRQAVFLGFVANVVLSRQQKPTKIAGRCILLLLTMTLFWPTVYRLGVDEEGTVYHVHRLNDSVEPVRQEWYLESTFTDTEPEIVRWYP